MLTDSSAWLEHVACTAWPPHEKNERRKLPTTTIELASCTKIVYEAIEPGSLPSHRDQAAMGECEILSTLRLYLRFPGSILGVCARAMCWTFV